MQEYWAEETELAAEGLLCGEGEDGGGGDIAETGDRVRGDCEL